MVLGALLGVVFVRVLMLVFIFVGMFVFVSLFLPVYVFMLVCLFLLRLLFGGRCRGRLSGFVMFVGRGLWLMRGRTVFWVLHSFDPKAERGGTRIQPRELRVSLMACLCREDHTLCQEGGKKKKFCHFSVTMGVHCTK